LTAKGLRTVKPPRRRARSSKTVRDPVTIRCTPVSFPQTDLGGGNLVSGIAGGRATGAAPRTTNANPPLSPPPAPQTPFREYRMTQVEGPAGASVSFSSNRRVIRNFEGSIPMTCFTVGGGAGPVAGGRGYTITRRDLPVANASFGFARTLPDYLTIAGSIDASQAYFRIVVGQGFAGGGRTAQCGGTATFRAVPR
jgi:hypothetical protein